MTYTAFCLAYAGFAALCLAMDRHYETVFDRAIARQARLGLRVGGWLALALSLWAATVTYGWSYGISEWIGMLAIAGLLLIWTLSYKPVLALFMGFSCALAAPVLAMM
jgi:hypothetical protein